MVIERARATFSLLSMVAILGATACQRWEGEYHGIAGNPEGAAVVGDLSLSGPDTALQVELARLATSGLRPAVAFDLFIVPPCVATVEPGGSTVSVAGCSLDPASFFLGSTVPEGSTLDLTGSASAVAADGGQVQEVIFTTATLNVAGASAVDVPVDLTALALSRVVPPSPG